MDKNITAIKGREDLLKAFKRADGLQRVTALLANARTKKRVADIVLNEGLTILGAANGEIDLVRNDGSLSVFAHKGYPHEFVKKWPTILHTIPSDTPLLINEVLQNQKASFIDDTEALPSKYKVAKSFFSTTGTKSVAVLPIKIKREVSGVIVFAFTRKQHFNKQEKIFMILRIRFWQSPCKCRIGKKKHNGKLVTRQGQNIVPITCGFPPVIWPG